MSLAEDERLMVVCGLALAVLHTSGCIRLSEEELGVGKGRELVELQPGRSSADEAALMGEIFSPMLYFDLALFCEDESDRKAAFVGLERLLSCCNGGGKSAPTFVEHVTSKVVVYCSEGQRDISSFILLLDEAALQCTSEWSRLVVEATVEGLARVAELPASGAGSLADERGVRMYNRAGLVCQALAILVTSHHELACIPRSSQRDFDALNRQMKCQSWLLGVLTPALRRSSERPLITVFLRDLLDQVTRSGIR